MISPRILGSVDSRTRRRWLTSTIAIGAGAGALSGVFGVGGGILIVPGLVLLLGLAQKRAHATSLAAIVPIAVAGGIGYAVEGSVDWPAAGLLTAGAFVGTFVGTHALVRMPERGLRILFALFMLAAAVTLPLEATRTGAEIPLDPVNGAGLILVGAVAGLLAGLLGVGGGIVMVPALVLLLSLSQPVAKGTSLLVIVPTALVGSVRNVRRGDVDGRASAVVGLAGAAFAFAGSFVSVRLDPLVSAVLFGLLLVAMAVRLLLAARGRPVPGDRA
jgi:uncharacterized membrane protein YfcA